MMRITNSMMTSNTKNNINLNKLNEDNINTQMATGQKISRPSDDPVVAIRALRLNTSLSQLNQYYDKNIPDAKAWLDVTETALTQTNSVFDSIKENLTTGANDTNTASDRQKILENLKGLRDEVYSSGNADYAGRTVFTGYRTGESLSFLSTDTDLDSNYDIYEPLTSDNLSKMTYITCADRTSEDGTYDENNVTSNDVYRIQLPYDDLNADKAATLTVNDTAVTVTTKSISGLSQAAIDDIYTSVPDDEAYYIPETGEMIIGKDVAAQMKDIDSSKKTAVTFSKDDWQADDLRPEHYFACKKYESGSTDPVYYNYDYTVDSTTGKKTYTDPDFKEQEMQVEVSFDQKITINTNASEVYTHDIGRDIDDLLDITEDVVSLEDTISSLKSDLSEAKTDSDKEAIQLKIDAANKEYSLKKDKMQKMFSEALDKFDVYADRNNLAIANVGSLSSRLTITKERVSDQIQSFTELADDNINISLTDTAIDLQNAELALQASQLAASKIAQQTLLNYL